MNGYTGNMRVSGPLFVFIFPFSCYIFRLQLNFFTMGNDDNKQERSRKSGHCSIKRYKKKPMTY